MEASERRRTYNTQRTVGVWLIYIGLIIVFSAAIAGDLLIQPILLGVGFAAGYFLIFGLPYVNNKLAYGKNSKFQDRMDNVSIFVTIVLCTLCGILIGFDDLRLIWLSIFIVIGVHFLGFYFSQGKLMILLAALTALNAVVGLLFHDIPFIIIALIDSLIKIVIGIRMLLMKRAS